LFRKKFIGITIIAVATGQRIGSTDGGIGNVRGHAPFVHDDRKIDKYRLAALYKFTASFFLKQYLWIVNFLSVHPLNPMCGLK
jgi:hypothetical protein